MLLSWALHHMEHEEPPRAFVTVIEPFGVDSEAPHQPWVEDEDHHGDRERCGDRGRREQDNYSKQPDPLKVRGERRIGPG
jgi:hypothetical protein